MGEMGATLLLDAISGKDLRHVVVEDPPELIVRRSSGRPTTSG
jgi:DNA-binding LacI/PurR family transcriptional regulator